MSHPTKFTVDRSKWLRGDSNRSMLLDEAGNMCCLGFVSKQCGVPDAVLSRRPTPWSLYSQSPVTAQLVEGLLLQRYPSLFDERETVMSESSLAHSAMQINDAEVYDEAERESVLARLFANHGYELEFIGEGRPA